MLVSGYTLRQGSGLDRAQLVKFMQRTYQELYENQSFSHLAQTVEQHFSAETPLWWVEEAQQTSAQNQSVSQSISSVPASFLPAGSSVSPVACLWLGIAIDQIKGWRYPHVFLLYVCPTHRRQGIGLALMHHAESWARARGSRQIGLQVFQNNQPALQLYAKLGYQTQSLSMVKPI